MCLIFFVRAGVRMQMVRSSTTNRAGSVTGEPSFLEVVRMPV